MFVKDSRFIHTFVKDDDDVLGTYTVGAKHSPPTHCDSSRMVQTKNERVSSNIYIAYESWS